METTSSGDEIERPTQRRRLGNVCQTALEEKGVNGLPIVAEAIRAYLVEGVAPPENDVNFRQFTREQVENWIGSFSTFQAFLNAVAGAVVSHSGSPSASVQRLTVALRSFDGFLKTSFPTANHLLDLSNQQMSSELWQMLARFTGHYVDLLMSVHQAHSTKLLPALLAHVLTVAGRVHAGMGTIGHREEEIHLHLLKSFHAAGPLFHKYMQKFSAQMAKREVSREVTASFKNQIEPMSLKQLTAVLQSDGAFVSNRVQVANGTIQLVVSGGANDGEDVFISMPAKATSSASMGQGHLATLTKGANGSEEALFLKIQRPNLAESIGAEERMMERVLQSAISNNPAASALLHGNFGLIRDSLAEIRAELNVAEEFRFAQAAARALNNQREYRSPYEVRSVAPVPLGTQGASPRTVLALKVAPGTEVQKHISERGVTAELPEAYLAAFRTWMENVFRKDGTGFLHADPHLGNLFFRERTHAPPTKPALTFIDFGNSDHIPRGFPLVNKIADFCESAGNRNANGLLQVFPLAPGLNEADFRRAYESKIRSAGQVSVADFYLAAMNRQKTGEAEFKAWRNAFEVVIQFNAQWDALEAAGQLDVLQKKQRREGKLLIKTLEALMMKWQHGWGVFKDHGLSSQLYYGPLDLWKQRMFDDQFKRKASGAMRQASEFFRSGTVNVDPAAASTAASVLDGLGLRFW